MTAGSTELSFLGQRLTLLPQRAIFWQQRRTLLVADPHFGKTASFRAAGVPIPPGTTADDLARLDFLLEALQPERLIVLGDLLHGQIENGSQMLATVERWRTMRSDLKIVLVAGNHDRRAGTVPAAFRVDRVVEILREKPFEFRHRPRSSDAGYVMAGHVHPAVRLSGKGGQRETLPCFCFGADHAVLPAFGGFTGSHLIDPEPKDRIYVIADQEVVPIGSKR